MGGIVVMRPVINEVEYIFPESEFGTYPNVEEVCHGWPSSNDYACCKLVHLYTDTSACPYCLGVKPCKKGNKCAIEQDSEL